MTCTNRQAAYASLACRSRMKEYSAAARSPTRTTTPMPTPMPIFVCCEIPPEAFEPAVCVGAVTLSTLCVDVIRVVVFSVVDVLLVEEVLLWVVCEVEEVETGRLDVDVAAIGLGLGGGALGEGVGAGAGLGLGVGVLDGSARDCNAEANDANGAGRESWTCAAASTVTLSKTKARIAMRCRRRCARPLQANLRSPPRRRPV